MKKDQIRVIILSKKFQSNFEFLSSERNQASEF